LLKEHGILNWRAKRRPHLTQTEATLRLAFARAHRHTDWSRYLFSDECSVEKGRGKKALWAFGYWYQKWDHDKLQTYLKGKQGSVMIWACIGGTSRRSELIIMSRDETSPRQGYTASSYTDTLEEGLLPIYDGEAFVQDNAPIHTAHYTRNWLANVGVYLLPNWPPYSPDLNPIEHLWYHLKARVYELRPDLDDITNKDRQREILCEVLPQAWRDIRDTIVNKVIESMPRRIEAVIQAGGWQTRY
jgi:transposase